MSGTPGPRPSGGDTDVIDPVRPQRGGTPYDDGGNLPILRAPTVGGRPYRQSVKRSRKGTQ